MPERARKHCLVALDCPSGPVLCRVTLPGDGTIAAALAQARAHLPAGTIGDSVDWDDAATGLWGVRCERTAVPRDGDRIELYRPLAADPRLRRRSRVRASRGR